LKMICISVFWNRFVIFLIAGLWYWNMAHFFFFGLSPVMFFWVLLLILIFRFILFCSFCIVLVGNPLLWAISKIVSNSLVLACFVIGKLYARWNHEYGPITETMRLLKHCKKGTTIQRIQQTNKRATNIRDQPTIQTSADKHGTVRTQHGLINRQTRKQATETTQYSNHRRRVDAGQNTRGTPTVNHDSGVGANEKNHGTTAAQHT
jgi:hypothetical protein